MNDVSLLQVISLKMVPVLDPEPGVDVSNAESDSHEKELLVLQLSSENKKAAQFESVVQPQVSWDSPSVWVCVCSVILVRHDEVECGENAALN